MEYGLFLGQLSVCVEAIVDPTTLGIIASNIVIGQSIESSYSLCLGSALRCICDFHLRLMWGVLSSRTLTRTFFDSVRLG